MKKIRMTSSTIRIEKIIACEVINAIKGTIKFKSSLENNNYSKEDHSIFYYVELVLSL